MATLHTFEKSISIALYESNREQDYHLYPPFHDKYGLDDYAKNTDGYPTEVVALRDELREILHGVAHFYMNSTHIAVYRDNRAVPWEEINVRVILLIQKYYGNDILLPKDYAYLNPNQIQAPAPVAAKPLSVKDRFVKWFKDTFYTNPNEIPDL